MFNKLRGYLVGKKTYIVATAALVLNVLVALNVITTGQLNHINVILGALGLVAVRAAL